MINKAASRLARLGFAHRSSSPPPPPSQKHLGTMIVHQGPAVPPPWRDLFTEHIGGMPSPLFTLATARPACASAPGTQEVVPRARTCVFRGLWGALPDNDKNKAERNPRAYESELPVFTTDARMDKMGEILDSGSAPAASGSGPLSGGGGPVEGVWWASHAGTQWRVRGHAWVLGPDIESDAPGARAVRAALLARMRPAGPDAEAEGWSWQREVTAHFGNLSPAMRGSFRNPPPGRPAAVAPGEGEGLGQQVNDLEDELARRNFRVVVVVPAEVDRTDLSDPERPRRWIYTYRGEGAGKSAAPTPTRPGGEVLGEWEKVEVWP